MVQQQLKYIVHHTTEPTGFNVVLIRQSMLLLLNGRCAAVAAPEEEIGERGQ